ncbi:hypothetical protein GOP47_0022212 [Adiantum capillus-veneris]|uniref:Receptor-like serine/threonine-protein kinase n=1 Tax=Adiantum capillus-veneris TaxID=13818 RepID=A0A9D4U966_ADICA|nr:hypothetical protein GOP47_0022212 [Adiantum capillus-veneris]
MNFNCFHAVLLALELHALMYPLLQHLSSGVGSIAGLPSSVPLGTSFNTTHFFWMQSQNERFQLDLRSWTDAGVEQCMGGVRYTFKTPNALMWTFNTLPQPLMGSQLCTLTLRNDGVLTFTAGNSSSPPWETPTAGLHVRNLTLQDDGNLVLVNDSGAIVWQSFQHVRHLFLIPSNMKFVQNMTLYDRQQLYLDYSRPGCYALRMGSQGRLEMFTRSNMYVYHSIGIDKTASNGSGAGSAIADYIVIHQDIEFYSREGSLLGIVAHNVRDDDPLPNGTDLVGSAFFRQGDLMINRPGSSGNPNQHLWYYNTSIGNFCDYPLVCGEYSLCNQTTRECSCAPGFQITSSKPTCTAQDEPAKICSCPEIYLSMPTFRSACIPIDSAYSLLPINVSFHAQPSAVPVVSQDACRRLCEKNISCNAALFDSNSSSCAFFPILYTIALPSEDNIATGQVMFLKISSPSNVRGSKSSTTIIVISTSIAAGAALIGIIAFMVLWRRWWHPRQVRMKAQARFLQELSKLPPRFSYRELQVATNDFSKRLGTGGFGSVYEGVLNTPTGVVKVAVKKLDQAGVSTQHIMDHQFKAEVATIGSVSHVNLVSLKGFCMEKNARLLAFEFMPRGSLDKWLYQPGQAEAESSSSGAAASNNKKDSIPRSVEPAREILDWETRCRIALDTAKGLEYLHHQSAEHIVHCDVKPANILLDEDFHAKVGDFGLAKLMGSDSQSFAMTTLKGTRGYVAPEWLQQATITAKSDVYSYGVVLLELLTGRRSLDPEHGHLPTWVMKTISAAGGNGTSTLNTADGASNLSFDTISSSLIQETIMDGCLPRNSVPTNSFQQVLMLALACVQAEPVDRPNMASVVQMLEGILEISYSPPSIKLGRGQRRHSQLPPIPSVSDTASFSISSGGTFSALGNSVLEGR